MPGWHGMENGQKPEMGKEWKTNAKQPPGGQGRKMAKQRPENGEKMTELPRESNFGPFFPLSTCPLFPFGFHFFPSSGFWPCSMPYQPGMIPNHFIHSVKCIKMLTVNCSMLGQYIIFPGWDVSPLWNGGSPSAKASKMATAQSWAIIQLVAATPPWSRFGVIRTLLSHAVAARSVPLHVATSNRGPCKRTSRASTAPHHPHLGNGKIGNFRKGSFH